MGAAVLGCRALLLAGGDPVLGKPSPPRQPSAPDWERADWEASAPGGSGEPATPPSPLGAESPLPPAGCEGCR